MNILHQIVRDTAVLVRQRRSTVSAGELARCAREAPATRSLRYALAKGAMSIIAEIKRASPSKGPIRPHTSAATIAEQYEEAGASAISVLTEPTYFGGALKDLRTSRRSCALPLLRKDFIIDPYQILEARVHGADAVLLIAAVLDVGQMQELHAAASELSLDCLVEVYALEEIDEIDFDAVTILGVNNRDLRTFQVDIGHSLRVFAEVPDEVVRVSESGIHSADQLTTLEEGGVDAVLIGESLMAAEHPGHALASLIQRSG